MARKGSSKELSVRHEEWVAKYFGGKRSKSSGGAGHDSGDVRTPNWLIECKMTGNPLKPSRLPKFAQQFEKIANEAYQEGSRPMLALRWYVPDSKLADSDGWVDLIVLRPEDVDGTR